MKKVNLFAPQWQGSGMTKQLYDGGYALKDYITHKHGVQFQHIEIDSIAVPELKNNIYGYDVIQKQLERISESLKGAEAEVVFVVGGGCGIEVPIVTHLNEFYDDLVVFWFDAHGDLNSPESSPSKHFHGMPLRFLLDGDVQMDSLVINKLKSDQVCLLGARDLDEPEEAFITENNIRVITVDDMSDVMKVNNFLMSYRGTSYIHIDLDVLDPRNYNNVKCPTENGIELDVLYDILNAIVANSKVVGMSLVENIEQDENRIKVLDDIIDLAKGI